MFYEVCPTLIMITINVSLQDNNGCLTHITAYGTFFMVIPYKNMDRLHGVGKASVVMSKYV